MGGTVAQMARVSYHKPGIQSYFLIVLFTFQQYKFCLLRWFKELNNYILKLQLQHGRSNLF